MGGPWRDRTYVVQPPMLQFNTCTGTVERTLHPSYLGAYVVGIVIGAILGAIGLYVAIPYLPVAP
jgi:hypothetical protein